MQSCDKRRKAWLYICRAWNNSQPLAIFILIFLIWLSISNLLGQIYCAFPMAMPLIVYCNVPALRNCRPISNCYFKVCICIRHRGLTVKMFWLKSEITVKLHIQYIIVHTTVPSWVDNTWLLVCMCFKYRSTSMLLIHTPLWPPG